MSLIKRIKQLFSPPDPTGNLGISLQQQAISYCMVNDEQQVLCDSTQVIDNQYHQAFKQLHQNGDIQGQCHVVLSSKQNQIVQIDKPQVPENEINAAVKWQVKELVTISPENMIVDYFDGPKLVGGMEKINVVCANKNDLASWVKSLSKNKITIGTITVEEFAFASLCPITDEAHLIICQQPQEDMLILIIKQGLLYFQRRLRGMEKIAEKSEDELNMGIIDSLSLEVQRSTDYFERQLKQAPIRNIDVLVPMKNEAYLARRLAENTHVPVNMFTMPEGYEDQREYAASIGATMLPRTGGE